MRCQSTFFSFFLAVGWMVFNPQSSFSQSFPSPQDSYATQPNLTAQPIEAGADTVFTESSDMMLQTIHQDLSIAQDDRLTFRFADPAFQMGGWIQQGLTLNPDNPDDRSNGTVLFNDRANDYQLNQLNFFLGREVTTDGRQWDLGGRVDLLFGSDSRYVTVPGLEEHTDRTARWNAESSQYGIALPQAFVDIGTPIGPYGSTLRMGHFYALGGYESFAAPNNFFYSHAYTFTYGEPFTHTGAMWFAKLNPTLAVSVAGTTGWDTFYSDNDPWGVRVGMMQKINDGRTTIALTAHSGQDTTGIKTANGTESDTRVWASLVLKHYLTQSLYYVFQSDFGKQHDAVVIVDNVNNSIGFDDAQWWGLNQYLIYQVNQQWSGGMRVEWFRDQGNSRVGVPIEYTVGGPAFDNNDYFAITAGLNFTPHSNVLLRQELRWDTSSVESNPNIPGGVAGIRPFNDRSDSDQLTLALDLVLLF